MSRKRTIASDLSTDPKIEQLSEYGPLPCLLYTWAIPHADDWGRMPGDPRQFRLLVCPSLRVTAQEVDAALNQVASVGLWRRYEVEGKPFIAFPQDSWFKWQTYIGKDKREDDKSRIPPPPPEECHKVPQSATKRQSAGVSVPTPTPTPTPSTESSKHASKPDHELLEEQRRLALLKELPTGEMGTDEWERCLGFIALQLGINRNARQLMRLRSELPARRRPDLAYPATEWDRRFGAERTNPTARVTSLLNWLDHLPPYREPTKTILYAVPDDIRRRAETRWKVREAPAS